MKRTIAVDFQKAFHHYLACALWASTDWETDDPLDGLYTVDDIDENCVQQLREEFDDFVLMAERYLTDDWTDEQIGHDFWLTRNGHGSGFWDRGLPYGDELSAIAKTYGSCDLYVGDDGKVYST